MKLSTTTDQADLPFVVVISGARNRNSQKDNISKVYGDLHNNQSAMFNQLWFIVSVNAWKNHASS